MLDKVCIFVLFTCFCIFALWSHSLHCRCLYYTSKHKTKSWDCLRSSSKLLHSHSSNFTFRVVCTWCMQCCILYIFAFSVTRPIGVASALMWPSRVYARKWTTMHKILSYYVGTCTPNIANNGILTANMIQCDVNPIQLQVQILIQVSRTNAKFQMCFVCFLDFAYWCT